MKKGANKIKNVDSISHPENKDVDIIDSKEDIVKIEEKPKDLDIRSKSRGIMKKVVIYFSIFFIIILLGALIAPFSYSLAYKDKVFPGIFVLGEEVGGKYEGELKKIVREKLEDNKFVFKVGDKEEIAEFHEMGLGIDFIRLSKRAISSGKEDDILTNFQIRYKSILYSLSPNNYEKYFSRMGVKLDYGIDEEKLNAFAKKISENLSTPEENAGIIIKGSDIEVIPAKYGERIIADSLISQIRGAIAKLRDGEQMVLGVSTESIIPNISEKNLRISVRKAKRMIDSEIVLTYSDKKYEITKEEIASWIIFEETKNVLEPNINKEKIREYLKLLVREIDVPAKPRRLRIENNTKEVVEAEGEDGLAVDVPSNTKAIYEKVLGGTSASLAVITIVIKAPVQENRVLVADWAKYIEIDLKNQRMVAYENQKPVFSDAITSGKQGFITPSGTFILNRKTRNQTMKGFLGTPEAYYLPNVQYISWFNGAIAIHQAYWRTAFGGSDYTWNGSHGCINATLASAKWIYEWAPVGTPVVVHN